jgi:8-oxo-dGTP pyrophosphatase MutT (NUDIX family)
MARRDHFYDKNAPKPNSIKPAAAVALFDDQAKILLLRRKDNDKWTMPGGTLDFGESMTACAIREVREETGFGIS